MTGAHDTTASGIPDGRGLEYLSGFGNEHRTEAVPGALPEHQNSPQRVPYGLYPEQHSGTAFTRPRDENRRNWAYRIRPSAQHPPLRPIDHPTLRSTGLHDGVTDPNRLRWDPMPRPDGEVDFLDSLYTLAVNGDVTRRTGIAIHTYYATAPMVDRYFADADGELLIVPQDGALLLRTEYGLLRVRPGEFAVISRGTRFRAEPCSEAADDGTVTTGGTARGYVCENHGAYLRPPDLGPIGANGLAARRHFRHPVAAYEDIEREVHLVQKYCGRLWTTELDHSPLDVVAWHGNHAPYKYDIADFAVMGSIAVDHPDPSINTVLTSPTTAPGLANVDFVVIPPRWIVSEHTFRPPHFHRNIMAEFMGLVRGTHDSKAEGFVPGGASLHNMFGAHGPDLDTYRAGSTAEMTPQFLADSLPFMFETAYPLTITEAAHTAPHRQRDYDMSWSGLPRNFRAP